jgi:hypothetical protein
MEVKTLLGKVVKVNFLDKGTEKFVKARLVSCDSNFIELKTHDGSTFILNFTAILRISVDSENTKEVDDGN